MTDKLDLDAIEARCNAATEGPWTFEDEEWHAAKVRVGNSIICQVVGDSAETLDTANFIAHARQDIPALTAALREAWAENEQLRAELKRWQPSLIPNDMLTGEQAILGDPRVAVGKKP